MDNPDGGGRGAAAMAGAATDVAEQAANAVTSTPLHQSHEALLTGEPADAPRKAAKKKKKTAASPEVVPDDDAAVQRKKKKKKRAKDAGGKASRSDGDEALALASDGDDLEDEALVPTSKPPPRPKAKKRPTVEVGAGASEPEPVSEPAAASPPPPPHVFTAAEMSPAPTYDSLASSSSMASRVNAALLSDTPSSPPPRYAVVPQPPPLTRKQRVSRVAYEYRHYFGQSLREVSRAKVHFFLGCTSIFLVVVIVAVAISAMRYSPVLFLGLAESQSGEIDLSLSAEPSTGVTGLNYTLVSQVLVERGTSNMIYHTPRHIFDIDIYAAAQCDGWSAAAPSNVTWSYEPLPGGSPAATDPRCNDLATQCLNQRCAPPQAGQFYLVDSQREERMQLGRTWPHSKVPKGSCYLQTNVARTLGLQVGDYVLVAVPYRLSASYLFHLTQAGYNASVSSAPIDDDEGDGSPPPLATIALRVDAILPSTTNKWASSQRTVVMMELEHLPELLAAALPPSEPQFDEAFRARLRAVQPHHGVSHVLINLPPARFDYYRSATFENNARGVVTWSSDLVYLLGFEQLATTLPCLRALQSTRFESAFLGLMLNVIIILLTIISLLLIYSLLMISVEARTFEMGIFRMVGMRRAGLVQMILVHAWTFAIPAWILGLVVAQGVFVVVADQLTQLSNVDVGTLLDPTAVGVATLLGLLLPLIAAILPIRSALGKNLHDALDTQRSKAKAVEITVERAASDRHSAIFLLTGVLLTAFGFMIYYFLPLALLSSDITSLFNIFLVLIMGMMMGLVVLALNLQPLIEQLLIKVVFLVLFFENRSVAGIVSKNLQAHRSRNRKTAITYATSLGFIIFLAVAVGIELQTLQYSTYRSFGAPIRISAWGFDDRGLARGIDSVATLEAWAEREPLVIDFAWVTYHLRDTLPTRTGTRIESFGRYTSMSHNIHGISSNFFETIIPMFYEEGLVDEAPLFTMSEQLYTPKGSRGMVLGESVRADMHMTTLETDFLLTVTTATKPLARVTRTPFKPIGFLQSSGLLDMSYFPDSSSAAAVSMPTMVDMSEGQFMSVMDLPMRWMLIKTPDDISGEDLDRLMRSIPSMRFGWADDARDDFSAFVGQSTTIQWIFQIVTLFTMVIAFFSLNTSMYTNIVEQSKEVGILRALGLTRAAIFRIYTYEALFLVLSSAFLGSLIGLVIGWSIAAQRALFTQVPLSFSYPWDLVVTVSIVAVVCALLSTAGPVHRLVRQQVVQTLRS